MPAPTNLRLCAMCQDLKNENKIHFSIFNFQMLHGKQHQVRAEIESVSELELKGCEIIGIKVLVILSSITKSALRF